MGNKTALIYGVTGQIGSYFSELLLNKSYCVIGVKRRTSTNNTQNITGILNNPNFELIEGDIVDPSSVNKIITDYKPDICINMAAQSHVFTSFQQPSYTFDVTAKGPLLILDAIKNYSSQTKYLQASSSEMFGSNYSERNIGEFKGINSTTGFGYDNWPDCIEKYQNEDTPLSPNSPYAIAKVAAHHFVRMYREAYGIFACAAIFFNMESPRRGEGFVTKKITKYIGQLNRFINNNGNIQDFPKLKLGNINASRDWSYAKDSVNCAILMLEQNKPDDFVIGTGEVHTIGEFLTRAFDIIGIKDWSLFVEIDPSLYRPCEVPYLRCDASKAGKILEWKATVTFEELVKKMVEYDIAHV